MHLFQGEQDFDKIHEECGVFGIETDHVGPQPAIDAYNALFALQHRGQTSAGIAATDGGQLRYKKGDGLVPDVFDADMLKKLQGYMAVGHVRYAAQGGTSGVNAQPTIVESRGEQYALVFNGSLTNVRNLRDKIEQNGGIFHTKGDAEVILFIIVRELLKTDCLDIAVQNTMKSLEGAYSFLLMTTDKLIAVRDPGGFRPLCLGERDGATVFASESCALDAVGARFVRNIQPGEIVISENRTVRTIPPEKTAGHSLCVFEFVYFARPDSVIDGVSVELSRQIAGQCLAKNDDVKADIVIGVPDSGLSAAMGYAQQSGLPYQTGFVKNRYIGRTFIQATHGERVTALNIKLNALKSVVHDRRVVLVDDSIVRGTTTDRVVSVLREAGAREVHMRIASPPFLYPCFFGTDIPSREDLPAAKYSLSEMEKLIGVDSLRFLQIEDLREVMTGLNIRWCGACFTGEYPDGITEAREG